MHRRRPGRRPAHLPVHGPRTAVRLDRHPRDYHDGDGPELALNDPDCLLASALVGRLDIPAGCELVAALAAMIRDAQATATRTTTGAAP